MRALTKLSIAAAANLRDEVAAAPGYFEGTAKSHEVHCSTQQAKEMQP
jgi:hypothetical protein